MWSLSAELKCLYDIKFTAQTDSGSNTHVCILRCDKNTQAEVTTTRSQWLQVGDDNTTQFWCVFIYKQWREVIRDGGQLGLLLIPALSKMSTDASSVILFTHIYIYIYKKNISCLSVQIFWVPISLVTQLLKEVPSTDTLTKVVKVLNTQNSNVSFISF